MTNKESILAHLVWMAGYDKAEAWAASKRYAAMLPEWASLPDDLTAEMNKQKAENGTLHAPKT